MPNILELHNATVYRGNTRVFDHLSLSIPQGENTAILGPNGAGKSTLLKLITREIYPLADEGRVLLFGKENWDVRDLRAHLGIVSNDLQHDYSGNVPGIDVVLSGLHSSIGVWRHQRYTGTDVANAQRILDRLGVGDLAERAFSAMSTGQQRRCLLGRALMRDPDTLVLDEPTSGLDLKACFQYLDIVRGLMRDGKTVLLVTHHLHEIPPEVRRVVLLKDGRVLADGAKEKVLTSARLSELFGVGVRLVEADGYFQVLPGHRQERP